MPIFNEIPVPTSTPALSMIEEQPADSPDISATDVDMDIAEGAMLTLGIWEQEGGTATQRRLTRLSLPLKPLEDGNCSLSEDETDGEGVEEAGKYKDSLWVQYLITTPSAEPWAISFLIPLDNGMSEMLPLQSDMCWDVARFSIAETMDVSVKALNIGYKFSCHTTCEPYCALSSSIHWLKLVQKASKMVKHLNKARNPKPFEVQVKDFSMTGKSKSEKGGKGGTSKESRSGKAKGKGVKRVRDTDDEGSKDGKGNGDKVGLVAQINAKTECDKHWGDNCYVDAAGDHCKLSKLDISCWALMAVSFFLFVLSLHANCLLDYSHRVSLVKILSSCQPPSISRSTSQLQRNVTVHPSLTGLKVQPLPHLPIPHPIQLIRTTTILRLRLHLRLTMATMAAMHHLRHLGAAMEGLAVPAATRPARMMTLRIPQCSPTFQHG